MPDYRRAWQASGTYFFTVNLLQRSGNDLLTRQVALLREVVRAVRCRHPFTIPGWVVLPDHLHCVIELPAGSTRTRGIMAMTGARPGMPTRLPG
jgi:putative transposase